MWCLGRIFNVSTNGGVSRFAKGVLLILLGVWVVLVLDLTSANPPSYVVIPLTALIFGIVGRMWRIEVKHWLERINHITLIVGDGDDE